VNIRRFISHRDKEIGDKCIFGGRIKKMREREREREGERERRERDFSILISSTTYYL